MKKTLIKIGYTLKFYRKIKTLSQADMASLIGISTRNYQRLELGEVEPKLETLQKISSLLNLSLTSLLDTGNFSLLPIEQKNLLEEITIDEEINRFSENLSMKDKHEINLFDTKFKMVIEGNQAILSDEVKELIGAPENKINIDDYLISGSSIDRWELVFRLNLKKAVIENAIMTPKGFKILQEYHFNIDANPDCPRSECYIRDITHQHEIESWLKKNLIENRI